jgi:predicted RNA-binding Zn-ribbon protein involved in translation (DUF1610 family)
MKRRCSSPKDTYYANYGGRGIAYDPRWSTFEAFLADMGPRPEGRTLDRVNRDGNYGPDNCRWATHSEQAKNRNWDPAPAVAGARAARALRPRVYGTKAMACRRCGVAGVVSTLATSWSCPTCRKAIAREATARYRTTHPDRNRAMWIASNARRKARKGSS